MLAYNSVAPAFSRDVAARVSACTRYIPCFLCASHAAPHSSLPGDHLQAQSRAAAKTGAQFTIRSQRPASRVSGVRVLASAGATTTESGPGVRPATPKDKETKITVFSAARYVKDFMAGVWSL